MTTRNALTTSPGRSFACLFITPPLLILAGLVFFYLWQASLDTSLSKWLQQHSGNADVAPRRCGGREGKWNSRSLLRSTSKEMTVLVVNRDWLPESETNKLHLCACGVKCRWQEEEEEEEEEAHVGERHGLGTTSANASSSAARSVADVVVYVGSNDVKQQTRRVHKHFDRQILAYLSLESPENGQIVDPKALGFDWKISYELTSDLPVTYIDQIDPHRFAHNHHQHQQRRASSSTNTGTNTTHKDTSSDSANLALLLISHCTSDRNKYLQKLMHHLPVKSYGKCLHNTNNITDVAAFPECGEVKKERKLCVMSKFKFYLAFENSNYTDYVTEKLFWALEADTVPVYFGSSSAREFVQGMRSTIFTDDFVSPQALASYLKMLDKTPALYEEYFDWKRQRRYNDKLLQLVSMNKQSLYCRVCEKAMRLEPVWGSSVGARGSGL